MLRIRQAQMQALDNESYRRFEDRTAADLRVRFPERLADVNDDDLRTSIREGVAEAKRHDVWAEADVRRFLDYVVEYGTSFGKTPDTTWAGGILGRKYLSGAEKMDRIDDHATFVLGAS